jgi:hypothetical protein
MEQSTKPPIHSPNLPIPDQLGPAAVQYPDINWQTPKTPEKIQSHKRGKSYPTNSSESEVIMSLVPLDLSREQKIDSGNFYRHYFNLTFFSKKIFHY